MITSTPYIHARPIVLIHPGLAPYPAAVVLWRTHLDTQRQTAVRDVAVIPQRTVGRSRMSHGTAGSYGTAPRPATSHGRPLNARSAAVGGVGRGGDGSTPCTSQRLASGAGGGWAKSGSTKLWNRGPPFASRPSGGWVVGALSRWRGRAPSSTLAAPAPTRSSLRSTAAPNGSASDAARFVYGLHVLYDPPREILFPV